MNIRPHHKTACTPILTPLIVAVWCIGTVAQVSPTGAQPPVQQSRANDARILDGAIGHPVRAWLGAIRSNDTAVIREMIENSFANRLVEGNGFEALVEQMKTTSQTWSTARLHSATVSGSEVRLLLNSGNDWVRFVFQVAHDRDPAQITDVRAQLTSAPVELPSRAASLAEFRATLIAHIHRAQEQQKFDGVVYVCRDGVPVFTHACGKASRRYDVDNTLDTRFNLASASKMLTAVGVMRLVEQGVLDLDARIGAYLPDYPNDEVRERVTVRHLLSHRSGMGTHFTNEFMSTARNQYRSIADYLPLFVDEQPAFQPGSRFRYSNAGYFVLGLIIERTTGRQFDAFLRAEVIERTGMKDAGFFRAVGTEPRVATGYFQNELSQWTANTGMASYCGTSAGGMYATAADMTLFCDSLMTGRIIQKKSLDAMWQPLSVIPGSSVTYGLGFMTTQQDDKLRWVGHSGGFAGVSSVVRLYPAADGYDTIVVVSNVDGGAPPIAQYVEALLPTR